MKAFETSLFIPARPERIWALLTDAQAYPRWNPTVTRVEGDIRLGEKITVHARISPDRAFPVTVAVLETNQRMVWSSSMPLGTFKGERTFTLTPRADGSGVDFKMREEFTGWLSGLITKSIPDLTPEFKAFAEALSNEAQMTEMPGR